MYEEFKVCNINSSDFGENIGCNKTDKSKEVSPRIKHIGTQFHLFRYNIYDKDTNLHGEIILEYWHKISPNRYTN